MSETIAIARPYAKAIFEYAKDSGKLSEWSKILLDLSCLVSTAEAQSFIKNPVIRPEQQITLMSELTKSAVGSQAEEVHNLLSILAFNKRMLILPNIYQLFEVMRSESEKTAAVKVFSYSKLTTDQEQHLKTALGQRLKRQVTLNVTIDKSLLGGAIIQAGDLVIDGSIRGKLNKLGAGLAA